MGFILVLETGQRFETNENGEFTVLPLNPGTYTLRVAADVHEAKDATVNVVAGEYAEVTLEARRQYSGGGTVLSQEYVIFAQCSARVLVNGFSNVFCGDLSGDGQRAAFESDYIAIAEDIRGMVTEMRAHQDGWYRVQVRNDETAECGDYGNGFCVYWLGETPDTRYLRGVTYPDKALQADGTYLEAGQPGFCTVSGVEDGTDTECTGRYPPDFTKTFNTIIFPEHPNRAQTSQLQPTADAAVDAFNTNGVVGLRYQTLYGAGLVLGVKAQFLQTVYLYELPEEGIEDFCALCDDADIPE